MDTKSSKVDRYLEKIKHKLAYLGNYVKTESNTDKREEIEKQVKIYDQIVQSVSASNLADEVLGNFIEDVYLNIRDLKRRLIAINSNEQSDYELFVVKMKEKNIVYLSEIDIHPPPKKLTAIKSEDLTDVNFPYQAYSKKELSGLAVQIITERKLLDSLTINEETLTNAINAVCNEYNICAYHNFTHGFSVFHLFFCLLSNSEFGNFLTPLNQLSCLLACLGHDAGHRGYNNLYDIKQKTKLAAGYCENGVLENLHAALLFKTLEKPEIKLLSKIQNPADQKEFKDLMIAGILATDMTRHARMLSKLTKRTKATLELREIKKAGQEVRPELEELAYNSARFEDKKSVIKNIVHGCDIGNPCLNYDNYMCWASLITQEFNYQTIKEEKRGIPVTGFLKYKDRPSFYASQTFFSKTFTLPLWDQITTLFEGGRYIYQNIQDNLKQLDEAQKNAAAKN